MTVGGRCGVALGLLVCAARAGWAQEEPTRLIVVVSVDQMRADYLERFETVFSDGFKRLTKGGTSFTEAHQDHGITATAAGHATISTGLFPSRHGVVSNDWWDHQLHRPIYAVEDTTVTIIHAPNLPGRSPANLYREAIGDWFKSQSPESKVYSAAIKDRAAVLMGGKHPDGVYWYNYNTGRFVTSSYYRDSLPQWVVRFNDEGLAASYFAQGWNLSLPDDQYWISREDSFPAERNGIDIVFPHLFRASEEDSIGPGYYGSLPTTPFGDELTFAFVEELIEHEDVGTDDIPDLLFVGASASDFIGHAYGPYSREIQDHYVRLDRALGRFLEFLDRHVGENRYVVVLTSDHGVVPLPEESTRSGRDAMRIAELETQELIVPAFTDAMEELGVESRPGVAIIYGLVIDFPDGTVSDETQTALRRNVAARLRESSMVADAYAVDDLREDRGEAFHQMYRRSFVEGRMADVVIRYKELYLRTWFDGTTDHISPYAYDTHVPLIFWGSGISHGTVGRKVRIVDVAPTLAGLLGITPPDDLDGVALAEIVR